MKEFIKSTFSAHFSMVFMAFIIFGTNDFTLKHPIINAIASILIIGIYLIMFYADGFRITTIHIRNNKKTVTPVLSWVMLYIIPVILLIWLQAAPMEYGSWMPAESNEATVETTEESEEPELIYTKVGIRQQAWFELYMQPYKGIYHFTEGSILSYMITMLIVPVFSILGYINGKRRVDVMKNAGEKFRRLVYRYDDEF